MSPNWKLLLFDTNVENFNIKKYDKHFGPYQILGLGNYKNTFIINRAVLKNAYVPLFFSICINFDSNITNHIRSLVFNNTHPLNETAIQKALYANQLIAESSYTQLSSKDFLGRSISTKAYFKIEKIMKRIKYTRNTHTNELTEFFVIYSLILKAFIIRNSSKKARWNKVKLF